MSHASRHLIFAFALLATPAFAQVTAQGAPDNTPTDAASLPVSASGGPAIDPTKNVLDLVNAESKYQDAMRDAAANLEAEREKRQDDLRSAEKDFLRAQREAAVLRNDDLREANVRFNAAALASSNLREAALRDAETRRVNDILAGTAKTLDATALAGNETAKALAMQVENSLGRIEARITALATVTGDRLSVLEQYQNQGVGRQTVADPQTAVLNESVQALLSAQSTGAGRDEGQSATIAFIFAGIGALVGLVGLFFALRRPQAS